MELRLLGPFEALLDGAPLAVGGGKQRALLALLALNTGQAVSMERLVDELWGDSVPETAHKMVQIYVSQLRKVLPPTALETRAPGYRLALESEAVDSHRFERLLGDGRRSLAAGRPGEAASTLRDGLALWRGPALAEFGSEPFAVVEGGRLEELRLAALEERVEADLALGRHADLVGELEALVARHPLRERVRGQQMLALYRSGRQAEALAAYQQARVVLDAELGIQPSASLRELERRILQQDDVLAAPEQVRERTEWAAQRPWVDDGSEPAAPFVVGRDAELGLLEDALSDALAGRRRLVFVTGEPGLGKTSVVESLLSGAGPNVLVGRGRCVEAHGFAEAYMPVLDALSRLCRSPEGDDVTARLRLHAPTWLTQLPWLVEADEVRAARTTGVRRNRDRMLREMGEALDAIAAFRPLVLVLEDLHWGDPSTLDLLGWLGYRDDAARLLVIGTYRETGDADAGISAVARGLRAGRRALELPLAPLAATDVAELVARRLPELELGENVAARLVERTGGNPLFVETVLDAWIADGPPEPGSVGELVGRVPDTVRALVERQLGELSEHERAALDAASVVGGELSAAAVAAALELPVDAVEAELDALVRRVGTCARRASPNGRTARSRPHTASSTSCTSRSCTSCFPARRRTLLHERVAECLEAAYGERASTIARQLASHYVHARAPQRAVRFLMLAAEQSASRSAYPETIEHARAALDALAAVPPSPERDRQELALQTLLGQTLVTSAGWSDPGVEAAFLRARELCEQLGDNEPLVPVLLTLGTVYEVRGEFARAQQIVAECLEVVPDADTAADTQELLACSLFHQGAFTRALEHAEIGVSLLDDGLADDDLLASFGESSGIACYDWAALAFWFLGYPDRALERAQQAVALAQQPERRHSLAAARATAAVVHQCRHELEAARTMAEGAIAAAAERGYRYRLAMGSAVSGWARALAGDADSGIPLVRRGLELSRATGATMDDPYYLGLLAEACLAGARFDEGLDAVGEALAALGDDGSFYEAELHRVRASLRLRAGDRPDEVEPVLREALAVARRQHARSLELRVAVDLGRLLAARGDPGPAFELVEPVLGGFTEGRDAPDLVAAGELVARLGGHVRERVPVGVAPTARVGAHEPAAAVDGRHTPTVRYARSGDVNIAYQVTGRADRPRARPRVRLAPRDATGTIPATPGSSSGSARSRRLIRFDKRGTGLSDRPGDLPDLETRMDDVRAVMDAAGSERAVAVRLLGGRADGGALRGDVPGARQRAGPLRRLRDAGPEATTTRGRRPSEERAAYARADRARVGLGGRHAADVPERRRRDGALVGAAGSSGGEPRRGSPADRDELTGRRAGRAPDRPGADARAPSSDDLDVHVEEGRYIASRIPGARFVELPGRDHFVAVDADQILDEVEAFVDGLEAAWSGSRTGASSSRISSDRPRRPRAWATATGRDLVARHDRIVEEVLARHQGDLVDTAGDGVLAVFDGPVRAIRAALELRERLGGIELKVRVGVHTGEIERTGDAARGIAVHLAARVAAKAEPGEVLVTSTTRDLVAARDWTSPTAGSGRSRGSTSGAGSSPCWREPARTRSRSRRVLGEGRRRGIQVVVHVSRPRRLLCAAAHRTAGPAVAGGWRPGAGHGFARRRRTATTSARRSRARPRGSPRRARGSRAPCRTRTTRCSRPSRRPAARARPRTPGARGAARASGAAR